MIQKLTIDIVDDQDIDQNMSSRQSYYVIENTNRIFPLK